MPASTAQAIQASETEAKGTVLITNAEELMDYNKSEEKMMEDKIKEIADAGVKFVVSGGSISEMACHFLEKFGIMSIKIMSKFELRRICRTTGANTLVRLEPPTAADLGSCAHIHVKEIGSTRCTIFDHESEGSRVATIVVRGSTANIMEDVERAIDDGVSVVKSMTRDSRFVPGAGATELLLADTLTTFGEAQPGLEQYAIQKYAVALQSAARMLAENSGFKASSCISALLAAHTNGKPCAGLNIEDLIN